MKRLAILLLLLPLSLTAQVLSLSDPNWAAAKPPAASAPWHPTNSAGATPIAFYTVTGHYATNGGSVYLTNQMDTITTLVNSGAESTWPVWNSAAQNGQDTLSFSGDYLVNDGFRLDQPSEYFVALKPNGYIGVSVLFSSTNESQAQKFAYNSGFQIDAGTSLTQGAPLITNTWYVLHCIYTNGTSLIVTNNITCKSGNAGVEAQHGLTYGATAAKTLNFPHDLACLIIYTNLLTTANRSNVYWWLTNTYAIPAP